MNSDNNNQVSTRFLLIDDDPLNNLICRLTIETILGKVSSLSFTNPKEGLEYLQSSFLTDENLTKTILLLDINMPVMTGWEFLERFDNLPPQTKELIRVYILSSSVDQRDRERSYTNKNVMDFLVKPLTKENVLKIASS